VNDGDYLRLLALGDFADPTQEFNAINPAYLRRAPEGTLVPVLRTGGLGDVLMAAVAVRAAAVRYPRLRFGYYTGADFVPLFQGQPWLAAVDQTGNLHGRQNWVIDLRGYSERERRERKERIGVFIEHLLGRDAPLADRTLHGIVRPGLADAARGRAILNSERPVVGIVNNSHSAGGYRNWPTSYVERLAALVHDHGWRAAILDDRGYTMSHPLAAARAINLTGRLTLLDLCAVMAACQVVVAPDTGTFHLGEALGVPTIGYFTMVPPEVRSAGYRHVRTFYAGIPCAPCYHAPTCGAQARDAECAKAITPEAVFAEALWMAENPPPYADNRAGNNVRHGQPVAFRQPVFHVEHPANHMLAGV